MRIPGVVTMPNGLFCTAVGWAASVVEGAFFCCQGSWSQDRMPPAPVTAVTHRHTGAGRVVRAAGAGAGGWRSTRRAGGSERGPLIAARRDAARAECEIRELGDSVEPRAGRNHHPRRPPL